MPPATDLDPSATVRVLVVHHPRSTAAGTVADAIVRHFEGDSIALEAQPIPTRVLSAPTDPDDTGGLPHGLDLAASTFSVAILLADTQLQEALAGRWSDLRRALVASIPPGAGPPAAGFCLPLVIALDEAALDPLQTGTAVGGEDSIHAARGYDWPDGPTGHHGIVRIILHASRLILDGLQLLVSREGTPSPPRRSVFLSHAKADLPENDADSPVSGLADRMRRSNYGLDPYFDETHALPGWRWWRQFEQAINGGALVAFDGDAYPARPVCQRELLHAKRTRRPILVVDTLRRQQRTRFAYGGNLPVVRVPALDDVTMDQLMLDLLNEMLRAELWLTEARASAELAGISQATLLPRPVELADMAFHVLDRKPDASDEATLVYPDPPLPPHLRELIDALRPPGLAVRPLSDLTSNRSP